jgi:hypothetical protein
MTIKAVVISQEECTGVILWSVLKIKIIAGLSSTSM